MFYKKIFNPVYNICSKLNKRKKIILIYRITNYTTNILTNFTYKIFGKTFLRIFYI